MSSAARGGPILDWLYFAVAATLVYFSYRTGFQGDWQFDDALNLSGLANVRGLDSALVFVFGGMSTDLGRPLALASFLVNRSDWPCCTAPFREINVLIHLGNGLLVFLLARRIVAMFPAPAAPLARAPLILATLWLAHPLLVSSNMFAVQRMTSLSATFVLLGLLGYLAGRERLLEGKSASAYTLMSLSLGAGAILGVLVKESAALLPLFAAVAELTLLRLLRPVPDGVPAWRAWRWLFFFSPVVLLVGYAASHWPAIAAMDRYRPFDLSERLASEAVILWQYVRQILVPDVSVMGPYQDDARVYSWHEYPPVLAALAWCALAAGAWRVRTRWPVLPFAVGWFATGHLLESSVFPLELYFEHRNYLASLGPLALLVAAMVRVPVRWVSPLAAAVTAVFLFLNLQAANVWGKPALAAVAWAGAHPGSVRATKDLAGRYLAVGDRQAALQVLQSALGRVPLAGELNLDLLLVQCLAGRSGDADRQFAHLADLAATLQPGSSMLPTFHKVVWLNRQGRCGSFGSAELRDLADKLLANPRIGGDGRQRHVLHIVMADLDRAAGDREAALTDLAQAYRDWPQVEVAQLYILDLISLGRVAEARREIARVREQAPGNPWQRKIWLAKLNELESQIGRK